ncbi:MAG: hypothetical protein ACLTDF_00150 [Coprococcus sp.]
MAENRFNFLVLSWYLRWQRSAGCRCICCGEESLANHGRLAVKGADLVDKRRKFSSESAPCINWDVGYPYVNKAAFQTLRDDWGAMQ